MSHRRWREQLEPESAPKPECDAESGCSSRTARSDRSHQGSDCSSSGYSSASFGSNRSKDNDCDFNSRSPFNPETFRNMHEALLKSQQEVMRQHEDVSRQREDLSRQREDLSRQREDLLRQREDLLRQREDFLRQQAVQQEAQQKIINVGDEQHLRTGTTHSSGSKRMDEMNEELERTRSALKEKDMKIEDLEERIKDMKNNEQKQHHLRSSMKEKENENEDLKRIIKEKDEQLKLMRIQEKEVFQQKHTLRSLKDKEKETEALKRIINEKDEQLQCTKSASKEKQKETEALLQRVHEMEEQLQKSRSVLTKKEDEHEKLKQSIQAFYQQLNHNARSLKDKEKETEALKRIINEKDEQLQLIKSTLKEKQKETDVVLQRVHEMEEQLKKSRSALKNEKDEHENLKQSIQAFYQQQNHNARSLKDKEKETEALKRIINEKDEQLQQMKSTLKENQKETDVILQRVHEMESQLQKSRSALQEKEEQLKSFKDRVAGEVALSIKTGNTMSLNNPVSKNRLKEMYEDLRIDWPKIKSNLKSNNKHPDSVKELILKKFGEAKTEMRNRKMMIDQVFGLNVINTGGIQQKVDQYRQLTVQNLQMTLYSEKQDAGLKKPFLGNEAGNPQDVLEYLGSECFWLGCLMALNNPPLQPDWENHPPSTDRWDFFPRNIKTVSENE